MKIEDTLMKRLILVSIITFFFFIFSEHVLRVLIIYFIVVGLVWLNSKKNISER